MKTWICMLLLCAAPTAWSECFALHPSGKRIPVKEEHGETYETYALASWLPYGPPTIYYGKRYRALTPLQQSFVRQKECAHLSVPVADESTASCHALKALRDEGLPAAAEHNLREWIVAEAAPRLSYRGAPAALWDAMLRCAGER